MASDAAPRRTLRAQLILLSVVTLLPMLAFAGIFIAWSVRDQRAAVERGALETTRALRTAVDREIASTMSTLDAVVARPVFDAGDVRALRAELQNVFLSQPDWVNLVLAAPDGRQIVNLRSAAGETPSTTLERRSFDQAVRLRRPAVGDVVMGPVIREHAVAIRAPVVRRDRVLYVLSAIVPARAFAEILTSQGVPANWVVSIVDSQNRHVARSRSQEKFVGQPVSKSLLDALGQSSEGWIRSQTLEGQDIYASFSRSTGTSWSVALGVPAETVDGTLRRSTIGFVVAVAVAVVAAVLIAVLISRRVADPLAALADAAPRIVRGEPVALPRAATSEVEGLATALAAASRERIAAESALGRTSRLLQAVFEGTSDGVFVKDLDGRYVMINEAGARLLGGAVDDVIGKTDAEMFEPESAQHIAAQDREVTQTGESKSYEHDAMVRTTGSMRSYLSTKAPYRDAEGHLIGLVGITRDISMRKQMESFRARALEREQAARTEAEQANRAKDEFLAMLSHELRTPLNAVYGWARMLRQGRLDPGTSARALEVIERNASAQVQLIEDLLDISRIITGKMRLDVRPVDLPSVVAGAVDSVRPAADARGIKLGTELDPSAGPVSGDPDRLQQIIWNLLSNAVKFTPRDGRVDIDVAPVDGHVEIVVRDTGQGIPADVLPFVFDRFRQGDSSSTRAHGGLGLGLALVRHLTELHGGTVTASSEGAGRGATFVVRLPISMTQKPPGVGAPATTPAVTPATERDLGGARVLVVDDDPDALELVATMLRRANAEPRTAGSAAAAIAVLKSWRPDVIVSDLEMPGEDGYALLRRIQELERELGVQLPAVAVTAYGRIEDRVRTLSAGFAMHIPKPIDPIELAAVIGALARRQKASQEIS